VEFTNGDSLVVHFEDPFKFPVYINKTGFGELSLLNEYNSEYIFDDNFGKNHHTQDLFFVNISNSSDVVRFKSDSYTKYDIAELKYDSGSPTYNIASYSSNQQGTTNAIQYVSPSDTAILKSIKFYNQSVLTDIRIHLYQSDLSSGGNPSSSFFDVKNVTLNEWVSIDTEDFLFTRDAGENFNVGIEFLTDAAGRMGYQSLSGKDHTDKSFVKGLVSSNNFFNLNQFQIGGETLDGTWMIRLELATPYTAKSIQGDSRIKSLSAYPIPFSPLHNSGFLNIEYELDNFGPVHLKIYNVLGQLVSSDFDRLGIGRFYWDGKNRSGQYVASGFYVLQLSSNKSNKYKRLLLLR